MEYIIALLADMNCKMALPLLKEKLKAGSAIRIEVLLEAIRRLEIQEKPPSASERMVWLLESTPTEESLGEKTDSIFFDR